MKKWICALLAALMMLSSAAMASGAKLTEALMIYEDYDGNREEETVVDEDILKELQDMLTRASKNKAKLDNCTVNSTLFCTMDSGDIYDFAVATDGCPFIVDKRDDQAYRLTDDDRDRLWEIFSLVQEAMGYDAAMVLNW